MDTKSSLKLSRKLLTLLSRTPRRPSPSPSPRLRHPSLTRSYHHSTRVACRPVTHIFTAPTTITSTTEKVTPQPDRCVAETLVLIGSGQGMVHHGGLQSLARYCLVQGCEAESTSVVVGSHRLAGRVCGRDWPVKVRQCCTYYRGCRCT